MRTAISIPDVFESAEKTAFYMGIPAKALSYGGLTTVCLCIASTTCPCCQAQASLSPKELEGAEKYCTRKAGNEHDGNRKLRFVKWKMQE